jgi:hypothetical protein
MGGTQSKTTISQLSETITNIAMNNITRCLTTSTQNQTIKITNTGFRFWTNYKIKQTTSVNSSCAQDAALQAKLQNDIVNAISQSSSAEGVALLSAFGSTKSEAEANIRNIIRTNVQMTNIMETVNQVQQNQSIESINEYVWIFDNLEAVQGSEVFAAATLKAVQDSGIFNTISNHIDQTSASKSTNPFSWISDLVGNAAAALLLVVLFIVLIIIAMIWSSRRNVMGRWESDILVQIKN